MHYVSTLKICESDIGDWKIKTKYSKIYFDCSHMSFVISN